MKSFSVLFILASLVVFNSDALAQRGDGPTRGDSGSGETRGSSDGGSSRGDSGETRSSGSSSSDSGGSSSGSDYGGSSSSCCDSGSYGGDSYGGSYGGSSRVRKLKVNDYHVGQKVELISTGDKGVITYIKKSLFKNYVCIEFDVDHTEECGFKADMIKAI